MTPIVRIRPTPNGRVVVIEGGRREPAPSASNRRRGTPDHRRTGRGMTGLSVLAAVLSGAAAYLYLSSGNGLGWVWAGTTVVWLVTAGLWLHTALIRRRRVTR